MHTLAQPYFTPSSQMARIWSQVAVWDSRVWSTRARMGLSSLFMIKISFRMPYIFLRIQSHCSRKKRLCKP